MTSLYESLLLKLANVVELATQDQGASTPQAKQALVRSTKDFKESVREAREYAAGLPGGEMSVQEQDEVIEMLERLKERKRRQLAEFAETVSGISTAKPKPDLKMEPTPNPASLATLPPAHDSRSLSLCDYKAGYPCFPLFAARIGSGNMHNLPSVLSVTGLLLLSCCADLVSAGGGSGSGSGASSTNVTWITPTDGDAYAAGDTIVGRWTADEAVVSPSFRICITSGGGAQLASRREKDLEEHTHGDASADDDEDDDDGEGDGGEQEDASGGDSESGSTAGNCGQAVWPTIGQSDGSYFVHLALPNVTSVAQCYLEMVDDFGDKMASPVFSFGAAPEDSGAGASPATAAAVAAAAAETSAASTEDAPAPASDSPSYSGSIPDTASSPSAHANSDPKPSSNPSPSPDTSPSANTSPSSNADPSPSPSPSGPKFSSSPSPSPNPGSSSSSSSKASTNPSTEANTSTSPQSPNTPQILPSMDDSHVPIPPAAYAVPLALVGSVILAAGALAVHQRRKLRCERAREHAALQTRGALLSRHSTLSFAGFVKLGREGAGAGAGDGASVARSGRTESRSTSVSRMRAWRRDVPHLSSSASEATYAYRTDDEDARSVASYTYSKGFTAFPAPLARRLTREPFHAHARRSDGAGRASQAGARRATMVPAGVWRAGVSPSPVFPSTDSLCTESDATPRAGRWADRLRERERQSLARANNGEDETELGRLKRRGHALVDPGPVPPASGDGGGRDTDTPSYLASSITDSVLDRYCLASPVPPSLSPAPAVRADAPSSVARPERLHVKRYAEAAVDLGRPVPERDLYDVVARRISRGPDV
ncbi:hypothetical protein ACG7TL_000967 [Trametes sanguinea]